MKTCSRGSPVARSGLTSPRLVTVGRGGVDVPVTGLERSRDGLLGLAGGTRKTPNPSCGICSPLPSETLGTWLVDELMDPLSPFLVVRMYRSRAVGGLSGA